MRWKSRYVVKTGGTFVHLRGVDPQVLLIVPGGFMVAAYGAIAREIYRCMNERAYFVATTQRANAGDQQQQG